MSGMAVPMKTLLAGALDEPRIHPVHKWLRACHGGKTVVDSRQALLVWEPGRVVPSYAVPVEDVDGDLAPYTGEARDAVPVRMGSDGPPVVAPGTPFNVHSCAGTALNVRTGGGDLVGAAFAPQDAELSGYVVLDWHAFDEWFEEEQAVIGHPHDPFIRIDCLPSSRHIVVALDGEMLADTSRAVMLFETLLPVRYYIPREDIRMDLLERSDTQTVCAYKGVASYWSANAAGETVPDIAWSYPEPLHDAVPVVNLVSFFNEGTDLIVDGETVPRPVTPWS